MHMFMYTTPTFILKHSILLLKYSYCYSELTPYTATANSYWVSLHDEYQYQGYAH